MYFRLFCAVDPESAPSILKIDWLLFLCLTSCLLYLFCGG